MIKVFTAVEFEYIDTIDAFMLLKKTLRQQPLNRYEYLQIDNVPEFYQGLLFTIEWNPHSFAKHYPQIVKGDEIKIHFSLHAYQCSRSLKAMEC